MNKLTLTLQKSYKYNLLAKTKWWESPKKSRLCKEIRELEILIDRIVL